MLGYEGWSGYEGIKCRCMKVCRGTRVLSAWRGVLEFLIVLPGIYENRNHRGISYVSYKLRIFFLWSVYYTLLCIHMYIHFFL